MDPLFTRAAWDALDRAADHAVNREQRSIEPRHILYGLLKGPGAGVLVLRDLGVDRDGLAGALDDSLPRRQGSDSSARPSDLPYTRRAEEILDQARSLAREDGRDRVGTADVVLALAAEKGITRTILRQFGVEAEEARSARSARADAMASEDRDEEIEGEAGPLPAPAEAAGREPVEADPDPARKPAEADDTADEGVPESMEPPRQEEPDDHPGPDRAGAFAFREATEAGDARRTPPPSSALDNAVRRPFSSPAAWEEEEEEEEEEAAKVGKEDEEADEPAAVGRMEEEPAPVAGDQEEGKRAVARPFRSAVPLSFLSLDGSAPRPLYRQIAGGIEEAAATGTIEPGARLPSIRDAADILSVSSGTVARAYRELEDRDVVHTRGTRGTFVAAAGPVATAETRIRTLAEQLRAPVVAGYHLGAQPEELHRALDRAMEGILVQRDEDAGGAP